MEDLQDKIIELMDLFDGEVTTADKINPPEPRKDVQDIETINRFMRDNPPGMAGGGMLVQPSVDGSRPGYASDFVNINDIKKYNKNLLDKSIVVSDVVKAGANQAERVTLQNIFDVVSRTKDGDELIKNFKKTPNAENFLKLKTRRKNRLNFEREQALPPEEKAELRKKQKIAEQKWRNSKKGLNYYNNYLSQSGIFPARTAEERVWRDIYRASKQKKGESRFILKYPKSANVDKVSGLPKTTTSKITGKEYIPWDRFYKDITFYDTVTKKNIKFNTVRNWMANNIKNGAKKYDDAVKNYKSSNVINTFEVDGIALSKLAKDKQKGVFAKRITTAAAVNHRSGLNNFWDTEVTTASGNKMLNDKVQQNIAAYKNASNPNIEKKLLNIMKQNAKKIEGGATVVLDDKTVIGKKPTIKSVVSALEKELDVKIPIKNLMLELAATVTDKCAVNLPSKKDGGRIGYNLGSDDCFKIGKEALENGLTKGFKNKQQVNLAETILKAGGGLKSMFALRNIFGPAAIAATVAFEGGLIGYDMLTSGKTLREAFGDNLLNYALGKDYQIDPQEEMFKRFKGLGYNDQQIGSIKRALDAMNTINTGTQLAMDVGQQQEALQKSRGQTEEFMIPDDQMMADTAGQRAEQNLKDAQERLTAFNQSLEAVDRPGGMKKEDVLEEYFSSGKYAQDLDLFDQAKKAATVEQMQSALPTAFGKVFPKFEESRIQTISENLPFGGVNPAFNIPGARDATFIPGKTVGGLYGLAEGGRAGYKLGKIIKPKPSKVRADAKSIIDENIKLMKQMKETGEIKEISSDLNQVIKKALDEDLFDKKDRIVDSINISEAKKRRNYPYNMQVQEEPKNLDFYTAIQESNFKTKTGPYFDRIRRLKRAGGGLLKLAGDRSGPPPESGPNSQGLQGLLNRGKNI